MTAPSEAMALLGRLTTPRRSSNKCWTLGKILDRHIGRNVKRHLLFIGFPGLDKLSQDLDRVCELILGCDWGITRQALSDEASCKTLQSRTRILE